MSIVNAAQLLAASGDDGYKISRSVRLRSSASAYLNRTFSTPTNNKIFTWSGWVKRGLLGGSISYPNLFGTGSDELLFYSATYTDQLALNMAAGASCNVITTQVFRDPSAWYHIIVAVDTTQATASNRVKIYVNGVQVTSFATATYPSLNYSPSFNSAVAHNLGNNTTGRYFDGYLTEVNFIDGQALTPSSFGQNDAVTGVWGPKKYAGTYGTNGFYLNFSDNSAATAAAIGKDSSGNGNNWTPNNISVTAGVTYDSMIDTPTPYADGGNGRGNYAVLNPINTLAGGATVSGGNLNIVGASASAYGSPATMLLTSGKWYFEVTSSTTGSRYPVIGVQTESTAFLSSGFPGGYTANGFGYGADGNKYVNNGAATAFGSTFTNGDVIGVAIDIDAGKVWLAKNNTWQASGDPAAGTNAAYTPTAGTPLYPCVGTYSSAGTHSVNFGQRPFAYTPPTGFKALNTQNLPDGTIKAGNKHFDATTFDGITGGGTVVNSGGFQPDFVWMKARNNANNHELADSVRGTAYGLFSNLTNAEVSDTRVSSFNSNGFSYGTNSNSAVTGRTSIGWQWKGGGAAVSNTAGSITSQVSANTTAGFSVVTYTGTGAAATIGHGLNAVPSMIITHKRSSGGTANRNWPVRHKALTDAFGLNECMFLNLTNARGTQLQIYTTAPTSSVYSVGSDNEINESTYAYVAYCFSEVAGFSKFGSYTGNGSADGPFVYCGFRPRWVMVKRTDSSTLSNWLLIDTARSASNNSSQYLIANLSDAEYSDNQFDVLSNGFKCRFAGGNSNTSGATYIFAAFAENPFKNSLAR